MTERVWIVEYETGEQQMYKVSYDTYSKEWILWRPNQGIVSTHKTRKEAEDAKAILESK